MLFIPTVNKKVFDGFISSFPSESLSFGEEDSGNVAVVRHYVGLQDETGELAAAALLQETKPALFPPYFYAPNGLAVDFFDESVLAEFTCAMRNYAKNRGAMFVAVSSRQIEGVSDYVIAARLEAMGYRRLVFKTRFDISEFQFFLITKPISFILYERILPFLRDAGIFLKKIFHKKQQG